MMSILNKEFHPSEGVTNWNDWNGQFIGYTSKSLEQVNKSIPIASLAAVSTSSTRTFSNPSSGVSFKEETIGDRAFGSSTVNSNQKKHPNESDKMTSLKLGERLSDNRTDPHRNDQQKKDQPTDGHLNQAGSHSSSPNERSDENIDFTSLHNDVISLADQDAVGSNCIMPSASYQFNQSTSSSLAPAANPFAGLSNVANSSVLNSSISSPSPNSSSFNAHRPHPNHFNSSSHFSNKSSPQTNHKSNRTNPTVNFNQSLPDTQQSLNVDDGLTSLSWLQNMSMTRLGAPTPPASPLCNLMPNYFSGISPQSTNGQAAVYSSQQQYHLSNNAAKGSSKPMKGENGRKAKHCKPNGSKSKPTTSRRTNKPNCQNAVDLSIEIPSSQISSQNGQIIDATPHRSDYAELSSSLDLTCNGGDHSALRSDGYLCNELSSRPNVSPLDENDLLSGEPCDQFAGDQIDFDANDPTKPPFSYASLIGMAMKANHNKMTLRAIYKWIREKFIYYRNAPPTWQNSIRHNLSLNKHFIKIPRGKDEPGKGGFWRLDPIYEDSLVNGVFKKRKQPKNGLDSLVEVPSEKKKGKKKDRSKKSDRSISQSMEYSSQQTVHQACQVNDNLMMHDTPPNSAESYNAFIENQTEIEITSSVNSIDRTSSLHRTAHQSTYLNPATSISQSEPSSQPQLINDCSLTQCNPMNGDSTHSLQPVHLVSTSNQLAAIASHQLVGQTAGTPNHYMIHLTNGQDPQTITIEPMTNGLQSLHSGNGCTFSNGELTQLTSLQATGNEVCLDSSSINLTTLTNGQLPDNCLLASDADLCWNTILTDDLRLVDTIGSGTVYSTNHSIPLTAIPISSQPTAGSVLNSVTDSQQTSSSGGVVTNSIINSISSNSLSGTSLSGSIGNAASSSSSQSPSSASLLTANNAQVSNLILSSTSSNCTTSYCTSNVDTGQFANSIGRPMNGQLQHLNGDTIVHNVVTCAAPASTANAQHPQLSSWDANGNYMNLVYSHPATTAAGEMTAAELSNSTSLGASPPSANLNSAATLNCASAANENHGSPVVIQINSNGLGSELNCAHQFDGSNSMPTWIECTLQGSGLPNGKVATFESNAFDLDNFSDLENCLSV